MANTLTLTNFTEVIYAARDIVAGEPVGFSNSVMLNSNGIERVSLGGTVKSFRTAQPTLNTSFTPAMTIPDGDDQTLYTDDLTVTQVANVRIPFKGETVRQLENTAGFNAVRDDLFAQAFRKIRNTIEAHIGTVAYQGASRATGTAGTTPFASTHNAVNDVRQILVDNGCPVEDGQVSLVINTTAGTNLRNLTNLYKVNEAGNSDLLRRGVLQDISGIMIKESAGVASHTKGTGASYLVNQSGLTTDSTSVTVDTGSGTVLAGDVVTFASGAGSGRNYVVGGALASNAFTLNRPGLRGAIADNNAITVGNDYTANVAFHKNAIELVMRAPAMPDGGDAAVDRMTIYDAKSGLVFEVALYLGYGMNLIDITTFYQAKAWKPEFIATLRG
jgi:hypothetical protein